MFTYLRGGLVPFAGCCEAWELGSVAREGGRVRVHYFGECYETAGWAGCVYGDRETDYTRAAAGCSIGLPVS